MEHSLSYGELTETPIGPIGIYASSLGIVRISFLEGEVREAEDKQISDLFKAFQFITQALTEIYQYLNGQLIEFSVPIDWGGMQPFQREVLEFVARIPYGEVRTYGEIAAAINSPGAGRAVGSALARNPIPLLIPCHRVVGYDMKLHGFAAPEGIKVKEWLLRLEGVDIIKGRVSLDCKS